MKRVVIGVFIGTLLFVCGHRPAWAIAEFCPANLEYPQAVGTSRVSSAVYGFRLTASDGRTIASATLAFDTSAGWYTATVPAVTLNPKVRHFSANWVSFTRRDYVSPIMYVRFPSTVGIAHAWIDSAAAEGDSFGWQAKGLVECDPPPAASPNQTHQQSFQWYRLDPKDDEDLGAAPTSESLVISATPSTALESANCSEPFRISSVKSQAQPSWPSVLMQPAERISTTVMVAINADGTLADAWVLYPSGFPAFDDSAVQAAKYTTYSSARSYCKPVSSLNLFRVTFDPDR